MIPHISSTHQKLHVTREDGQELRTKHVKAIIKKNIVQQVGIKYYICSTVAQKIHSIKFAPFIQLIFHLQISAVQNVEQLL